MSNTLSEIPQHLSSWKKVPDKVQAMSSIRDSQNQPIINLAFSTHRDVITDIGYSIPCSDSISCPPELETCVSHICQLAYEKPIMTAQLITPANLLETIFVGEEIPEPFYYYGAITILLLKDALSSYANFKKSDIAQWEFEENKGESLYAKYMD